MRSMIKTAIFGLLLTVIMIGWDPLASVFNVQNFFQDDSDLLIKIGSMIGYTLFIGFSFFVQQTQLKDVLHSNKNKGVILYGLFTIITTIFLSYMVMDFSLQVALVNLMLYLIIVSVFDFIGERIILVSKARKSHVKSII